MQYQLEHHMFPSMPRYKSRLLVPVIKQFAKDHNLPYKACSLVQMYREHFETLRKNAMVAAVEE
jgi:fatty acid desaturase